jgi:flagellar hook-associated protein 2
MAVSSTNSSSSSSSTASIDVAGIVQQLMTAENRPLDTIKTKITQQQVVISDLGNVRSKVSSFKDALSSFQSANSYNNRVASTSDSAVVSATASNGAIPGSYTIQVGQIAAASKHAVSGYSSATAPVTLDGAAGFTLTVGTTTYSTKGTVTVNGVASASTVAVLGASPTVTDLSNWINGLGTTVKSGVVQTTSSSQWALTIEGTQTGTANAVTYAGLTGTVNTDATVVARNAQFTLNGIAFERATNSVTDAVGGLSLNLLGTTAAGTSRTIAIASGPDNSEKTIKDLVTAYNDLIGLHKTLTANNANSTKPGTFANNPTMLAFIEDIKSRFSTGLSYGAVNPSTGQRSSLSLASLGMDLQRDGTVKFNSISHAAIKASNLNVIMSQNVNVGYISDSNTLLSFVDTASSSKGVLSQQIESQNTSIRDLKARQGTLETKLNVIQNNYIKQYSALNALLFQLSSTSNSLTSALDALTNNNNNN